MNQKELAKVLLESLNKNKGNSKARKLDQIACKPAGKKLADSIFQGQEENKEIIESMLKSLESNSNPFHDLAALYAKKYQAHGSDLEKIFKEAEGADLILESSRDAYIRQDYPYHNCGKSDVLFAGKYKQQKGYYRTYLYFDTRAIPAGTDIHEVKLKLNLYETDSGQNNTLEVYRVIGDWKEDKICWHNQPPIVSVSCKKISLSSDYNHSIEIDVTDLLRYWLANPGRNTGLMLKGEEKFHALTAFKSRRFKIPEMRPRLKIRYLPK